MKIKPRCMATTLPGIPHKDPVKACEVILENFPEAPCVPRLTVSMRMYLEGMPCVVIDAEKRQLSLDLSREQELLEFYEGYEARRTDQFAISPRWAPGLYTLVDILSGAHGAEPWLIHFNIPGPLTWGLTITGMEGIPSWYNELARDIVVKTIYMKIVWIEKFVKDILPGMPMMITLGEPSLAMFGTPFGSFNRQDILNSMNEALSAIDGVSSVHCCANIDWTLLTETNTEVINFDAFRFSEELALYGENLNKFLQRGGMLAWGIVPADNESIIAEDIEGLTAKLEQSIQLLVNEGIEKQLLLESSFVTTSCETCLMSTEMAERAFQLTSEISRKMRSRYF